MNCLAYYVPLVILQRGVVLQRWRGGLPNHVTIGVIQPAVCIKDPLSMVDQFGEGITALAWQPILLNFTQVLQQRIGEWRLQYWHQES